MARQINARKLILFFISAQRFQIKTQNNKLRRGHLPYAKSVLCSRYLSSIHLDSAMPVAIVSGCTCLHNKEQSMCV